MLAVVATPVEISQLRRFEFLPEKAAQAIVKLRLVDGDFVAHREGDMCVMPLSRERV